MEKLDAIVAAAGGVILVVAVIGAALSGGTRGSPYEIGVTSMLKAGAPLPLALQAAGGRASANVSVPDLNVSAVSVTVYINATSFPTGANAHVTLTSPSGKRMDKDGALGASGTVGQALAVTVAFPVASAPNATRVDATSASDALARASGSNATAGLGNWTIDVTYAPAGLVPPASAQFSAVALPSWTVWTATAAPAPPTAR